MDDLLELHSHQVFLRRQALARGYDDRSLRLAMTHRVIVRVRHGAYTSYSTWQRADPEERHRLRCHAALMTHGSGFVLSHTSAAVMHRLQIWRPDLSQVHLTRLDQQATRVGTDIRYHRGQIPEQAAMALPEGGWVTSPAHAAVEHASISSIVKGLIGLDSYLHLHRQPDTCALDDAYRAMGHWPGTQRLQLTMRLARVGAQSPGETRVRYLFWRYHVPEPELQYVVRDRHGEVVGISDFAWPGLGLLGEFDGLQKYGRLLQPGEGPEQAVVREKLREDRLREITGWRMIRLVWADLDDAASTATRVRHQLRLAA